MFKKEDVLKGKPEVVLTITKSKVKKVNKLTKKEYTSQELVLRIKNNNLVKRYVNRMFVRDSESVSVLLKDKGEKFSMSTQEFLDFCENNFKKEES